MFASFGSLLRTNTLWNAVLKKVIIWAKALNSISFCTGIHTLENRKSGITDLFYCYTELMTISLISDFLLTINLKERYKTVNATFRYFMATIWKHTVLSCTSHSPAVHLRMSVSEWWVEFVIKLQHWSANLVLGVSKFTIARSNQIDTIVYVHLATDKSCFHTWTVTLNLSIICRSCMWESVEPDIKQTSLCHLLLQSLHNVRMSTCANR